MLFELWCSRRLLRVSLDCKEIQLAHPKGNRSWILIWRADAEAETPVLWQPGVKNWLGGKDPDAGKDWKREEKGITENEMVGWHHQVNEHKVWVNSRSWWWTGRLGMLQSMGRKVLDTTEQLNWAELCPSLNPCVKVLVSQSCLTPCNPMDCSPPDFSAHGFSRQEYWSEWIAIPFSRGSSWPRDQTRVS